MLETITTHEQARERALTGDQRVRELVRAHQPGTLGALAAICRTADTDRALRPVLLMDCVIRLLNAGELHVSTDRRLTVTDRFPVTA